MACAISADPVVGGRFGASPRPVSDRSVPVDVPRLDPKGAMAGAVVAEPPRGQCPMAGRYSVRSLLNQG
eukprot:7193604-Alexandrium_andersonii.AAC.1